MRYIKYVLIGILFGIIMTKSEAISWYRIQEMFRFQAFHMYGIIGSALACGIVVTSLIKRFKMRSVEGNAIVFNDKDYSIPRYLLGGDHFRFRMGTIRGMPGPNVHFGRQWIFGIYPCYSECYGRNFCLWPHKG